MAKARSPQYPAIGLKEAIDKITAVYSKDYQNKTSREVIAKHMGYESLHGKALGVLSAVGKYGLLEGRGDENHVSDLAVAIIAHAPGSPERTQALKEAASKPELFAELDERFNRGKGSDTAIRSYLLTQKFIPSAADLVIRSYRETKQLVEAESGGYVDASKQEPPMSQTEPGWTSNPNWADSLSPEARRILDQPSASIKPPPILQEVFNLDEGPVTLSFPSALSEESYEELKAQLELFLRRAQRRARLRASFDDPAHREGRKDEITRRANDDDDDEAAS